MAPAPITGDPELDRLVPAAVRLIGAVRQYDPEDVAAAFDDAAATLAGTGRTPAAAVAVILAAMVPWDATPTDLLAWVRRHHEFERLRAAGVDPAAAATIVGRRYEPPEEVAPWRVNA